MMDPNLICSFAIMCSLGASEQTFCKTYDEKQFITHLAFVPDETIAEMWTADLTVPPSPALVTMPYNALNSLQPGWQEDHPELKHLGEGGVITFHTVPGIAFSSITVSLETSTGGAMVSVIPVGIGLPGETFFPAFLGHGTCQPFEKEG